MALILKYLKDSKKATKLNIVKSHQSIESDCCETIALFLRKDQEFFFSDSTERWGLSGRSANCLANS